MTRKTYFKIFLIALIVSFAEFTRTDGNSKVKNGKEYSPQNVTVLEGKGVLIPCNVTENTDTDVWWVKNETGSPFVSIGLLLRFNVINRADAGQYLCYANYTNVVSNSTQNSTLMDQVKIDVLYPGEVTQMAGGPNIVEEKSTFSISCTVVGNPDPTFEIVNNWTGNAMVSGNVAASMEMTSPPAQCYDTGIYLCTARNTFNKENSTKSVNITVMCKPALDLRTYGYPQTEVEARLGQRTILQVHVLSNPAANILWSKTGMTKLPPYVTVSSNPTNPRLIFTNITVDSYGSYSVNVSNNRGYLIQNFLLKPTGHPETPTDLKLVNFSYDSVTMSFCAGYDYGSRQRFGLMKFYGNVFESIDWFDDYSTNHGRQTLIFTSKRISADTKYKLAIQAENNAGPSSFSNSIEFRTPPYPNTQYSDSNKGLPVTLGAVFGALGFLAVLAILLYVMKYRKMKTSYTTMK